MKKYDVTALGELLIDFTENGKSGQGNSLFEANPGGAPCNVLAMLTKLGHKTAFIGKVGNDFFGKQLKAALEETGIDSAWLQMDDEVHTTLALVHTFEDGDRDFSFYRNPGADMMLTEDEIPEELIENSKLFHFGTLSMTHEGVRAATKKAIRLAEEAGALISFDVNFRANLWDEATAKKYIEEILPYIDILFVSEETSRRTFGKTGDLKDIMKSYTKEYPVSIVATTERKVISPKKHTFGSTIYDAATDTFFEEPPYENIEVVDRIGSGDAYVSGVLFGLLAYNDCRRALEIGNAVSAIKNTIPGDLPSTDLAETERIIKSHKNIGPQSEMNR